MQEKRIVRSVAESLSRLHETKREVVSSVNTKHLTRHIKDISKPGSPSSALRKAGVALIVSAPDPVSDVAGAALIATSYAVKRRDPTKLDDLAAETRKILRDIQRLSL